MIADRIQQRSAASTLSPFELTAGIQRMKREKNVVFLAHYYQSPENPGIGRLRW